MSRARILLALASLGCWASAVYLLGLPWTRSRPGRGDYLYGYYADYELFLGAPLLCLAVACSIALVLHLGRRRAAARRVLAVSISSLVAVAAFDLAFALLVAGAWQPQYWLDASHVSRLDNLPDPDLGFVRKPDLVWRGKVRGTERTVEYATDQLGFRNPAGTTGGAIALVGDSYTEAAQVDVGDTFARRLAERTGRSVWNLGRGAYGPQQELLVLERTALQGDPKPAVVVWQVFEGNDLTDAEEYEMWRRGDAPRTGLWQRYRQNSFFGPWLQSTYRSKRGDYAELSTDAGVAERLALRYRVRPDLLDSRKQGWASTEAALREAQRLCRAAAAELVVVFVPVAARVWHERLEIADPELRAIYLPEGLAEQRPFAAALRRVCADLGVTFVDLLPAFQQAARRDGIDGLYIPRDEHLDVRGHAVVAEAIASALAD